MRLLSGALAFAICLALATAQTTQCPASFTGIENEEFDAPMVGGEVDFSLCSTLPAVCISSTVCTTPNCCAVCQKWCTDPANGCGACLGKTISKVTLSSGSVVLLYVGGDPVVSDPPLNGPRQAQLTVNCGSGKMGSVSFFDPGSVKPPPPRNDGDPWTYLITATSSYACTGLPGGAVFLIILLVVAVVYVIGIVIYARVSTGAFGFPHAEFWLDTPHMAKDGVFFIVNKVRGKEGYQSL